MIVGLLSGLHVWPCQRVGSGTGCKGIRHCGHPRLRSTCPTTLSDIIANDTQLVCMISIIPKSGCTLDDTACVCGNDQIAADVPACMLANCTMQESLDTARVQAVLCDMSDESQRLDMFMWTGVIYSMAVVFVVLRIVGKLVNKRLAMDDYIVVFALVLCAVPAGCTLASK